MDKDPKKLAFYGIALVIELLVVYLVVSSKIGPWGKTFFIIIALVILAALARYVSGIVFKEEKA